MSATEHRPVYDLVTTLIGDARVVSLVGAGGKKTTLYALARAVPGRVAVSSSSHMAAYDRAVVDDVVSIADKDAALPAATRERVVAFAGEAETAERIHGLSLAQIGQLIADQSFAHVLLKADGARARWIKAPAAHEPIVPPGTDRVLYLVSVQVIGAPLDERIAHRVTELADLCETTPGALLTVEHLAMLLSSERGALQGVGACELLPVINMVDSDRLAALARTVACRALARTTRFDRVVLANMKAARVVEVITRADVDEGTVSA